MLYIGTQCRHINYVIDIAIFGPCLGVYSSIYSERQASAQLFELSIGCLVKIKDIFPRLINALSLKIILIIHSDSNYLNWFYGKNQ